jgi:hypothetical protein
MKLTRGILLPLMRKNLLILFLCAPLLWITGTEGTRLYNVYKWSSPELQSTDDEPPPKPEVVAKATRAAEAIVELPDGVTATVVRLEPPPPGAPRDPQLASLALNHARKRAERAFDVEKAKDEGLIVEKQIRQILKKMRGPDGWPSVPDKDLDGALEEYVEKVHDPELVASARAQAAWVAREENFSRAELDRRFKAIDHASADAAGKGARFDDFVASYRGYLNDHELAKESYAAKLTGEAKARLDLAQRGAGLVNILRGSVEPGTDVDPAKRRLGAIAAIAKLNEDNPPEPVHSTLRHVVRALCDDYLRPEPLDESVKLWSANTEAHEPVKRTDIQVNLKSGGEPVALGPDGEYSLPPDQIESITLLSTNEVRTPPGAGVPPLKGTDYSDAIREFNSAAAAIKQWSDDELAKLLDICTKNESKLQQGGGASKGGQTLVDRITKLREIVRSHPSLFLPDGP